MLDLFIHVNKQGSRGPCAVYPEEQSNKYTSGLTNAIWIQNHGELQCYKSYSSSREYPSSIFPSGPQHVSWSYLYSSGSKKWSCGNRMVIFLIALKPNMQLHDEQILRRYKTLQLLRGTNQWNYEMTKTYMKANAYAHDTTTTARHIMQTVCKHFTMAFENYRAHEDRASGCK